MSEGIKTDCIFYWPEKHDCKALKCLYCFTEKCKFYKSSKEYNPDGTKKRVLEWQRKH